MCPVRIINEHPRNNNKSKRINRTIVIVCEGKKTETKYFNKFKKRFSGVKIEVPNCEYTDKVGLVKYARRLKESGEYEINADIGSRIWCVFDLDINYNNSTNSSPEKQTEKELNEAKRMAGDDINIALSNPCFEIWYLLHYEATKTPYSTKKANIGLKKIENALEKYIKNYDKAECYYEELLDKQQQAVRNAEDLEAYHRKNGISLYGIKSNPSTQVFELVKYINNISNI